MSFSEKTAGGQQHAGERASAQGTATPTAFGTRPTHGIDMRPNPSTEVLADYAPAGGRDFLRSSAPTHAHTPTTRGFIRD